MSELLPVGSTPAGDTGWGHTTPSVCNSHSETVPPKCGSVSIRQQ